MNLIVKIYIINFDKKLYNIFFPVGIENAARGIKI